MNEYRDDKYCIDKCLEVYLYDIIDVLYSGHCYMLKSDELLPAILKKLEQLKKVQNYESCYKIKRVRNIVISALRDNRKILENDNCKIKIALEQIYNICTNALKNKSQPCNIKESIVLYNHRY